MKAINEYNAVKVNRVDFIETLSAEFTLRTGVGVYVFLTPVAINDLFGSYLSNSELTITIFAKQYVRSYSMEHNM